jgi:ribonuclease HI
MTGAELFHIGPLEDGTNNVAEYLALIHALALLKKQGNGHTAVYSDSRTALSWLRNRGNKSKLKRTVRNGYIFELLQRADAWIQSNADYNRVIKWDTDNWGEIPADFNRK